jgi:hypothetical protein
MMAGSAVVAAVHQGSCILVQCTVDNVRFLLTTCKKVLEMFCFGSQTHVTSNKHAVHCLSGFPELRELTESD